MHVTSDNVEVVLARGVIEFSMGQLPSHPNQLVRAARPVESAPHDQSRGFTTPHDVHGDEHPISFGFEDGRGRHAVNGVRKGPKLFELARLEQFAACPHFSRIGSPTFRTACRALLGGDGRSRTRKRDFRDGPQIDQRDPERGIEGRSAQDATGAFIISRHQGRQRHETQLPQPGSLVPFE